MKAKSTKPESAATANPTATPAAKAVVKPAVKATPTEPKQRNTVTMTR